MIEITTKGDWGKTSRYLARLQAGDLFRTLDQYGAKGAALLGAATPTESGLAASSWSYEVIRKSNYYSVVWKNSDIENGFPVAVMIQYGHGTGTGGYVQGRDYINPVIQPLFDQMIAELVREVKSL